jgi:hypothetical protein
MAHLFKEFPPMSFPRWFFLVSILAVAVFPASLFAQQEDPLVLVEEGHPVASIVIAASPSAQSLQAARALQSAIAKISGASLPIRSELLRIGGNQILVGPSLRTESLGIEIPSGVTPQMNEEGFVVKRVGDYLVLAGNEDWNYSGTLYAVHDFLEDLGCRWYFPGEYGEVLPRLATIEVGQIEKIEHPSFRFRNLWYSGWFPVSATDRADLTDWYGRNKLAPLNLSLPGDGSVIRLAPPEKYFESHPHIYALSETGERQKDMLCMTEEDSVRIAVETILDAFRENPDMRTFGFAPPDGFPMCHCQGCKQYFPGFAGKGYGDPSLSDLWFQYANRIATEVYKEFPDRWILTNGYANRVRPPESVEKFSPNLGIQSAVISACSIHKTGDPHCWQRLLYKQLIDRWTEALDCVFIYDYDPGNSLVNLPFPALHNLKHDLPYFHDRGVWGFWTEGTNTWMVTHLNYYVRGKLMWNVEEDVDALVRDYCEKFHGPAAMPVEEYIWTLEKAVEETSIHETWGRIMQWKVILAGLEDRLEDLLSQAERAAADEPFKTRVRLLRIVHDHMMAYVAMERAADEIRYNEAVAQADRMLEIREQAQEIAPGMLPDTPDWVKTFRTSLEWFRTGYSGLAGRIDGTSGELVLELPREWDFKKDPEDIGTLYQWYNPGVVEGWKKMDTTLYWEAQGEADEKGWSYHGEAWYKTGFNLPEEMRGKPLRLTIGAVYNEGVWVWVNGVLQEWKKDRHWRLGYHDVRSPIDIDITDIARFGEPNTVAVLVHTNPPGRNPRSGIHRRSFVWAPNEATLRSEQVEREKEKAVEVD